MSDPEQTLEQFIHTHLETVDQLRAFLLLCAGGEAGREALEIASRLYIPEPAALDILGRLEANGLAASEGSPKRFRCRPRTEELAALTRQVIALDKERPVTLLNVLYSRPTGIQAFIEAFKLRKERND